MSWGGSDLTNPSFSNIKSSFYFKIPRKMSAFTKLCLYVVVTDLVCGGEAVAEGAGVTVQPAVGVPSDGVVCEQGLGHWAGHLRHHTLSNTGEEIFYILHTPLHVFYILHTPLHVFYILHTPRHKFYILHTPINIFNK